MTQKVTQKVVEDILKAIAKYPDQVKVERTSDDLGVLLTVDIAEEDAGLIIGKEGATIKAIRTLARIIGLRNQERVNVIINEPWKESNQT